MSVAITTIAKNRQISISGNLEVTDGLVARAGFR